MDSSLVRTCEVNLVNLPDEIFQFYLLNYLDLDDVWNLRLVCRKIYRCVKSYRIKELFFMYDNAYFIDNWFSTTRPIKLQNILDDSKFDLLINPSKNLISLKYLRILNSNDIKLDDLNKFFKLQILEIYEIDIHSNQHLQLPDLRALYIGCIYYDDISVRKLVFDTPNLHSLRIPYLDEIDNQILIKNPLSIKYLRVGEYDNDALLFKNLARLECLECLDIDGCYENLSVKDLLKFVNLRKLGIKYTNTDGLKNLFKSKKDDLVLVLDGVRIKKIGQIDEYQNKNSLDFQINNCNDLEDDLHTICRMDYDYLEGRLSNYKVTDLLIKYTNIQHLTIGSKINDSNRLIQFISGCSNLYDLKITNSKLNQEFYDQLPSISSLCRLSIIEESKDLNLNFEFILKMIHLQVFYTNLDVFLSEKLNLNNTKSLGNFIFKVDNQKITIIKDDKDRFKIIHDFLDLPCEYINHNELVKWYNWLRNRKTSSRERESI